MSPSPRSILHGVNSRGQVDKQEKGNYGYWSAWLYGERNWEIARSSAYRKTGEADDQETQKDEVFLYSMDIFFGFICVACDGVSLNHL
jgi:hypothetical protein